MIHGSLFSGIGGIDLGFERAGIETAFMVEKDPTCQKVLWRQWPKVPCYTDVRRIDYDKLPKIDVLSGGFPCQDVSMAGSRAGLAGERSGLFFAFMDIARRLAPTWVLIENVDGLLSSNDGRDMGTILRTLEELGYGWAYRRFDSQFFGVAQRRRRIFIVGHLGGSARRAGEVLFEPEGMPWDPLEGVEAREGDHGAAEDGVGVGGGDGVSSTLGGGSGPDGKSFRQDLDTSGGYVASLTGSGGADLDDAQGNRLVPIPVAVRGRDGGEEIEADEDGPAYSLRAGGGGSSKGMVAAPLTVSYAEHGHATGDGSDLLVPTVMRMREGKPGGGKGPLYSEDRALTLATGDDQTLFTPTLTTAGTRPGFNGQDKMMVPVAISEGQGGGARTSEKVPTLTTGGGKPGQGYGATLQQHAVRRFTPVECERLQGFPDNWTQKDLDGRSLRDDARIAMLGNAVTVNVAEWIGRRLVAVHEATDTES